MPLLRFVTIVYYNTIAKLIVLIRDWLDGIMRAAQRRYEMKQLEVITNDQLVDQIAALAVLYRKRFRKSLGVTAEIGEYKAAKVLSLTRVEGNTNKGFDAYDGKRRVQIKTRISSSKAQRTGFFKNREFDYALLVLLSESYDLLQIYRAERKEIGKEINRQNYDKPSLSIRKFMEIGKPVYPRA